MKLKSYFRFCIWFPENHLNLLNHQHFFLLFILNFVNFLGLFPKCPDCLFVCLLSDFTHISSKKKKKKLSDCHQIILTLHPAHHHFTTHTRYLSICDQTVLLYWLRTHSEDCHRSGSGPNANQSAAPSAAVGDWWTDQTAIVAGLTLMRCLLSGITAFKGKQTAELLNTRLSGATLAFSPDFGQNNTEHDVWGAEPAPESPGSNK